MIAIVGDIHLGKISADQIKKDKIFESQKLFFDEFRVFCTNNNIKEIIWTGDIFDNNRSVESSIIQYGVNLFHKVFSDCTHHIILGNHCLYERDSLDITSLTCLEHLSNINVYKKPTKVNLLGKKFLFTPYLVKSLIGKFTTNIEKIGKSSDVVVGHFDIVGAVMESGTPSKIGLDMNSILDNINLTISGHYHNISEYSRGNNKIQYVGTPYQMTFGDHGQQRGFWTLDEDLNLKFYENKLSYTFEKIDYDSLHNIDKMHGSFVHCTYPANLTDEELFKFNKKLESLDSISFKSEPKEILKIEDIKLDITDDEDIIVDTNAMSDAINAGDMIKVSEVYIDAVPPPDKKLTLKLLDKIKNKVK